VKLEGPSPIQAAKSELSEGECQAEGADILSFHASLLVAQGRSGATSRSKHRSRHRG
jgi:hypothetical protein